MTALDSQAAAVTERGWVLYDDQCGFCFRWVHLWEPVLGKRGFRLKSLQSASADGTLQIQLESLLSDILILTPTGDFKRGADAYLFASRHIWWAWPFFAIFSLPVFNSALWSGYRWFNRNRYHVSRHCAPRQALKTGNRDRSAGE